MRRSVKESQLLWNYFTKSNVLKQRFKGLKLIKFIFETICYNLNKKLKH